MLLGPDVPPVSEVHRIPKSDQMLDFSGTRCPGGKTLGHTSGPKDTAHGLGDTDPRCFHGTPFCRGLKSRTAEVLDDAGLIGRINLFSWPYARARPASDWRRPTGISMKRAIRKTMG